MKLLCVLSVVSVLAASSGAGGYDSGDVLSNGGFEKKDLFEAANNGVGAYPWFTSNMGGNAISVTSARARGGSHSLKWAPIGWNVKDDGTEEEAYTFIINNCAEYTSAGADAISVGGFINTSALKRKFSVQVILANDSFGRFDMDTIIGGGESGWRRFDVTLPVSAEDKFIIAAFKVLDTTGVGAGDSEIYIDDLSLAYRGGERKAETKADEKSYVFAASVKERPFFMGFTPFPWDISEAAVESTYAGITGDGDIICHHFDAGVPWTEALANEPFSKHVQDGWRTRREKTPEGFKVFVALTPLNMFRKGMALYHGEKENMPLPAGFAGKDFDDAKVMKAYLNYCRRAVEYFRPDYLAIGIEVNELTHHSPEKWPGFVKLYKHVYRELKKEHREMPIFATFTLHNLLQDGWTDIEGEREKIRAFLGEVDIAGISFYPFMKTLGRPERPVEAFDWIREFVGDKPIAITETGFPAEATHLNDFNVTLPGSPEGQAVYYETLLGAAVRDDYLFVIAFLYRDYDALWEKMKVGMSGDWAAAWRDCGMLDGAGGERPSHEVWRNYLRAKYSRAGQ